MSNDPSEPIPTGTWLAYLTRVASVAGHPVPPDARDPQNREPFAWSGTLEGLADRLRPLRLEPPLDGIRHRVTARLDLEARSMRDAFETLPAEAR